MQVHIDEHELPDTCEPGSLEVVETKARGRTLYGARIILESTSNHEGISEFDDRSTVTFWGPPRKVTTLLRDLADLMERKATL